MQAISEIYSGGNVAILACAGVLALSPVLLRRLRRGGAGGPTPSASASLLPIIAHTRDSMASAAAAAHKAIGLPGALALSTPPRLQGKHEL